MGLKSARFSVKSLTVMVLSCVTFGKGLAIEFSLLWGVVKGNEAGVGT